MSPQIGLRKCWYHTWKTPWSLRFQGKRRTNKRAIGVYKFHRSFKDGRAGFSNDWYVFGKKIFWRCNHSEVNFQIELLRFAFGNFLSSEICQNQLLPFWVKTPNLLDSLEVSLNPWTCRAKYVFRNQLVTRFLQFYFLRTFLYVGFPSQWQV